MYTLNDFSGGLNTVKDPRDIKNNELVAAQNIMVDEQGAVRTVGGMVSIDSPANISPKAATLVGGYGLAMLESDYETEPVSITGVSNIDLGALGQIAMHDFITVFADAGGGEVTVTTTANHGMSEGDPVAISSTTNYDGTYTATNITSDTFRITHSWDGDDGTGSWLVRCGVLFPPGSEIIISGSASSDGYYTVRETDNTSAQATKTIAIVTGAVSAETDISCTVTSLPKEEILLLLSDADNGEIDSYSKNQDTWTDNQIDLVISGTLDNASRMVFYSIDGAIRATDSEFIGGSRIRWFGQIKRTHFGGTTAEDNYFNFFEKDNKLSAPTAGEIHASNYPTSNSGFNITVTHTANSESLWENTAYQVAFSFIYDGNQESLLYIPSANHTFTPDAGDSVTVVVRARTVSSGYNPRISGGRVYAKVSGSDEAWFVLCDIDMRRGARATLDGDYTAWTSVSSTTTSTGSIESLSPNLDTYESINGYSHDISSNSMGERGEQWKFGLVTNRRAFVFNVRRYDGAIGENVSFGDRIYFSEAGRFDTFPSSNYIDVVRGDSESYVAASEYADRILAFKDNSVQIVNISSPSPSGWFLEKNEKYMGVVGPACVVKTQYGIVWVNDNGCFLYNGSSIKNLMDDKIDDDEWADFIGNSVNAHYSSIGYEKHKKQLIIMRDCTGTAGSSGDAYLYDFKTKSWVKLINAFSDSIVHSNFIHDWNGDLVVGYESGGNVAFKKWDSDDTTISKSDIVLTTKDIDFGSPALDKKVYAAYVTYKSSAEQNLPLEFAVDGTGSFSDFSTGTNVQPQGNTGGAGYLESTASAGSTWDVATFTADSVQTCQSIQFKFNPPTAGTFNINDISIEYRQLRKRVT